MSPLAVAVSTTSGGASGIDTGPVTGTVAPTLLWREQWQWLSPNGSIRDLTEFVDSSEIEKGMTGRYSPPLTLQSFVVPGRSGAFVSDSRHEVRELDLPLVSTASSASALRSLIGTLAAELNTLNGPGILRHIEIDGSIADLFCYCVTGYPGSSEGTDGPVMHRETLIFQAFDPYWYQSPVTVNYSNSASAAFFPILPLHLTRSTVLGDSTIENTGDVIGYPQWVINGPGTAATLVNETTGQTLEITHGLSAGEQVLISTTPGQTSVIGPGGANWRRYLTSRYLWTLEPGVNDISLSMEGGTSESYIQMTYRPRTLAP